MSGRPSAAEVFEQAAALPPEKRAAVLDARCLGDAALRAEVESLLRHLDAAGTFLEAGPFSVNSLPTGPWPGGDRGDALPRGASVGRYRILDVLGEGGMGVVYRAEQQSPRREVALKLIRASVASQELMRRFAREAEALGRLQHPAIAQVFEAGTADVGFGAPQPYLAMELVHGVPITAYATAQRLSTRQRLELFARVCEGVQHAHERGIIHRDLKPANILVAQGQPKIVDFGVARATDASREITITTGSGQLIGTLQYMSPEQVSQTPDTLDGRTDVYSLGIVLYELLAGRPPYEVSRQVVPDAVRTIMDEEPTRLSSLSRSFRGDIETIVGKALEKDRARRYASAADLAADIRRSLRDEPVEARPPSAIYQVKKFARRNRGLTGGVIGAFAILLIAVAATRSGGLAAGVVGAFVFLVIGVAATSWQAVRATRQKRLAEAREARARTVVALLGRLLGSTNPRESSGADYKVRPLLDEFAAGLGSLAGEPEVEATVRAMIGKAYQSLGALEQSRAHLERALSLRRVAHGPDHPEVARALLDVGWLRTEAGDFPGAEAAATEAAELLARLGRESDPLAAEALQVVSTVRRHERRFDEAESAMMRCLDILRQQHGRSHEAIAMALNNLAMVYKQQDRFAEAERTHREGLAMREEVLGADHPDVADSLNNLGAMLFEAGRHAEALPFHERALDIRRRFLGQGHHVVAQSLSNLATVLWALGRAAEAEAHATEGLGILRRAHGEDHPSVAWALNNVAVMRAARGDDHGAVEDYRQAVAICERRGEPDSEPALLARRNLPAALLRLGRFDEAEPLALATLERSRRESGAEHPATAEAERLLAHVWIEIGRASEAEPLLRHAVAALRAAPGIDAWRVARVRSILGQGLTALGRFDEAGPLLVESHRVILEARGEGNTETAAARRRITDWVQATGREAGGMRPGPIGPTTA